MSNKTPRILQNSDVYIDGVGLAASHVDVKLPDLSLRTKEHSGGGMWNASDIVIGGEKLTLSFGVVEYNAALVGTIGKGQTQFTFRGYARGLDGSEQTVVAYATGMVLGATGMEHKPGDGEYTLMFSMSPTHYALEIDGQAACDIDVINGKYIMGGVDLAAGMREALGH